MIRLREETYFSVELTPLIDVVFLLIIFFLVATTFQQMEREMAVSIPEAETGKESRGSEPLVVNVLKDGDEYRVIVEGNTISLDQLRSLVALRVEKNPGTGALIRADGRLFHQQVVRVTDACRKARAAKVSISTLEKTPEKQPR